MTARKVAGWALVAIVAVVVVGSVLAICGLVSGVVTILAAGVLAAMFIGGVELIYSNG